MNTVLSSLELSQSGLCEAGWLRSRNTVGVNFDFGVRMAEWHIIAEQWR